MDAKLIETLLVFWIGTSFIVAFFIALYFHHPDYGYGKWAARIILTCWAWPIWLIAFLVTKGVKIILRINYYADWGNKRGEID